MWNLEYTDEFGEWWAAMGGELDIIARFPDGDVHITQFKDIENRLS